MTDQNRTPAEETPAKLSSPKAKKANAYDEPFRNEKAAPFDGAPAAHQAVPVDSVEKTDSQPKETPPASISTEKQKKPRAASNSDTVKKKAASTDPTKKPKESESVHASTATPHTASAPKKERDKPQQMSMELPRSSRPAHKIIPFVLYGVALFAGITMILNIFCNPWNTLSDPSMHWMGVVGYSIAYGLFGVFGQAAFAIPLLLINLGVYWKKYIDHKITISKIIASFLFLIMLGGVIHVFNMMVVGNEIFNLPTDELMRYGAQMTGGGVLGGSVAYFLYGLCSFVGALIIEFLLMAASLFYLIGMTPQHLWEHIRNHRKLYAKRTPSYSEQTAEEASNRVKMEEKIRRSTARGQRDEEQDFESEAPLGAVRVVTPAKKNPEDKIAPMPMPRLDPNDGEDVFVPETVNRKMSEMEESSHENEMVNERRESIVTASAPATEQTQVKLAVKEEPKSIDPASNRDAAVEPIFPKTNEHRQVRKVPKSDRNFDLKSIFIDPEESDRLVTRKYAPLPPEVPLSSRGTQANGTRPATAPNAVRKAPTVPPVSTQSNPAARPATAPTTVQKAPTPNTQKAPSTGTQPTPSVANVRVPATGNFTPTVPKAPAASAKATPVLRQAAPQKQDFGLSNEEFEKLEAQQVSLPRPGEKKPQTNDGKVKTAEQKPAPKPQKPPKPKKYVFPPISYLHPGEPMTEENRAELEASMNALAATLKSFHVGIEDNIRYSCGPTVTRYEITPAAGVRVRTITNLADDIALSLRSSGGIRIEAPIPGTNAVGIEVPNKTRSTIYLRELIESKEFSTSKNKLTACLGAGIAGEPLIFDIAKMPHLLIAGTTGSGKSVCINCIVMSLLYKATPDEVKLVMIDPKKVEFSIYKNIPHLMAPVVTTPKDAAGALQASVEEMERRFELFETVGVRDLKGYNAATADDPDMPALPHIVIIIDELADLMMTARDEVETAICRIAQKARAAGLHLIIGTQRPSADVVTGLIKSNVPSRIAFAVKSQVDSRVILDHIGAEALTGRGDMLFVPIGSMRDTRVQGAFVDDKEVENICEFIRATNGTAVYDENFITKLKELAAQCGNKGKSGGDLAPAGGDGDTDKSDNKYADAVRIAIEEKRISTSLLQRKLEIGYSRAAKLIDRMQSEGLVSAPDGSKPRTILITAEEYMARFVDNVGGEEE